MATEEKPDVVEKTGFLDESLSRTNKQIRAERGDSAKEDLEMVYKREVEDWEVKIKRLNRKRLNNFDFAPTSTQSLVVGRDMDAGDVKEQDLKLANEIRNATIKLRIAMKSYNFLFGETYKLPPVD